MWDASHTSPAEARFGGFAAAIPSSSSHRQKICHETKDCSSQRISVQAKGHLAVSLGTTSVREARVFSAYLSADFERAWAMVEKTMNEEDGAEDLIDALAMTITEGFRKQIKMFRAVGASRLDARVREKAYAILEADLRGALELTAPSQPTVLAQEEALLHNSRQGFIS